MPRVGRAYDVEIAVVALVRFPPDNLASGEEEKQRQPCPPHTHTHTTHSRAAAHSVPRKAVSQSLLTLQCSHRFLIALRTFIPRVCCVWTDTAPRCCVRATAAPTAAAAADPVVASADPVLGGGGERMACEQHRVCSCTDGRAVAGRADETARRRIDDESDLDADAVDRTACDRIGRLAIAAG